MRSIDSVLDGGRLLSTTVGAGPPAGQRGVGPANSARQQWVSDEPVRQNSSSGTVTRPSPIKEPDMAATRGPNVSILHLRSTSEPWETSPTSVYTTSGPTSSRSYSTRNTSTVPIPSLTKHQSLGGAGSTQRWNTSSFHSGGEVNSTEMFINSSCNRELSPVRWCDREVDGVYLGRSGWVQVQQRSLDENRRTNYCAKRVEPIAQGSKRTGIKLAEYHCNSEPGKYSEISRNLELQRPVYLPLRGQKEFEIITKTPSPSVPVPESYSPPSVTPIISPPPAFQDRNSKGTKSKTFFGKQPFLPRSNAIVDSDASPPTSPQTWKPIPTSLPPPVSHRSAKKLASTPSPSDKSRGNRIPQTKSLEDTTTNRRMQFLQKYGESSSSSSSSMGFRSLDSYVPRPAMPRLSENTDSSVDVYEDADDEDNNSSSLNLSVVSVQVNSSNESMHRRDREKISPTNRQGRVVGLHRAVTRRSPGGSDTKQASSPSSSSSSCGEFPVRSPQGTMQAGRRSAPRPYQSVKSQDDPSLQRVRRSRSLQLPEKRIDLNRLSPQHPEHRVLVKQDRPPKKHKPPETTEMLEEEMLREAEVVTGFLYGNRSRAAAQALLIHRYNNGKEEKPKEPPKPNNGFNIFYVGSGSKERQKLQRGSTAPNLNNKPYSSSSQIEVKCSMDNCDFWPHCSHRTSIKNQNQSMMRVSHSYPSHQRSLDSSEARTVTTKRDNSQKYTHSPMGTLTSRKSPQHMEVADIPPERKVERRPSPSPIRELQSSLKDKKVSRSSPVNPKSSVGRVVSANVSNRSNSSSSSDVYVTTSDRTGTRSPKTVKSSGASTPLDEQPPLKDEIMVHEEILTRPGSAPGESKQDAVDQQQRSMSLPKSFLSASYGGQLPWRKRGAESLGSSPGIRRRGPAEASHTAPVTPLHESNRRRSPLGGASRRTKANSTPQLLEPADAENRKWKDKETAGDQERVVPKDFSSRRTITGQATESVLQKFRKTFSLRFQKKGSKESCSSDIGENLSEILGEPSEEESPQHVPSISPKLEKDQNEQKYKFGPLTWRSSKERKKSTKAARNSKCNSGDSGIQIEMPSGSGVGGDSSESHDTDPPGDDVESPPAVRRRPAKPNSSASKNTRPQSDLLNQILIDRFKAELKTRANKHQHVRRTHSDLGGQRLLHWDPRIAYRRMISSPSPLRSRPESPRKKPPDVPGGVQLRGPHRRGQLRRSLSQPLDMDKLPPLIRTKITGFKTSGAVLSEDEHDIRGGGTSDDDMLSDSESSIASLSERKKSLELAMDEDVIILAEAVFDHVAIEAEELAFRAGDVIEVLETANRDWWWGTADGKTGWFPAAFVRLRVSQEDTVEDCLAAMASGNSGPSHLRRRTSISLLSNDQVRTSVVRELVHTERDFVKVLQDVAEGYLAECIKRKDMFSKEQIDTIFINLEDILKFQSNFLKDLEAAINWDLPHKSCVGSCFIKHKDGFKMYSDYCNSHTIATATLQELYQYANYSKFFEACRLMRGLIEIPLDGYLLTPVQRICKYPLQLAELLKYTKPDHPDYENIKEALEAMRGVAVLINERKRRMESLEKLAAWQQRVEGWEGEDLIETSSQLIHQGEVDRVTSGMWTSSIILFLFDNQLVYCKKDILKRNTYVYKGRMCLETTEVIDIPDGKDVHSGVTVRHAIKLHSVISDKWLLVCCRSSSDKQKWLSAFNEERRRVAQDKSEGLQFHSAAKQLARVAAKSKRRPPRKPRSNKNYKRDQTYMGSTLHLSNSNSNSLGRKMGTWFTFGGNKKSRHRAQDIS